MSKGYSYLGFDKQAGRDHDTSSRDTQVAAYCRVRGRRVLFGIVGARLAIADF